MKNRSLQVRAFAPEEDHFSTQFLMSPSPFPKSASREIQFTEAKLPGCFILQFPTFSDERGVFVKTVQSSLFKRLGLDGEFCESFYTVSGRNVLRGMHVQLPPHDQAKLVYCTAGSICDMALDLRRGSPAYGKHEVYELSAVARNAVYLPSGVAHGFYVREEPAVVVYHVTSEHDPVHDVGVLWSSFGAPWPVADPVVSQRDSELQPWADFVSPFAYSPPEGEPPYRRRTGDMVLPAPQRSGQ